MKGNKIYTVALKRSFVAYHFLTGGNWGNENQKHPHDYRVEVRLEGIELDEHGYLADLTDIQAILEELAERYRGQTLNELPEFLGINPSLEHFARIFQQAFSKRIRLTNLAAIGIKIWENELAWASYREEC